MDIERKTKLKSLEDIASNYKCVLIDNCSFHALSRESSSQSVEEKLNYYVNQRKYLGFWKENLKYFDNFYVTLKVIEEIEKARNYNYKKAIKKTARQPLVLELRRAIRDSNKERNRLMIYMRDSQKILEFDGKEEELHTRFCEKYLDIMEEFNIGDVDFDLLIYGLTTSQTRGSSAIISNDFGIVRAWNYLSRKEEFSVKKFGFFSRRDFDNFRMLRL